MTKTPSQRNAQEKRPTFSDQLIRLSLASSLPILLALVAVLFLFKVSFWLIFLTTLLAGLPILYVNYQIHQKVEYHFRSLTNLVEAIIQGDYNLRANSLQRGGASGELVTTINNLASHLSQHRWDATESQLLLQTIIEHIDVAIVALNPEHKISFLNPTAKKLLMFNDTNANPRLINELQFVHALSSGCHQVVELTLGQQKGKFNIHVEEFREAGLQHKLLFITDVKMLLRSEETKAWQNLVRVISHEINNSLSPINSISQTLTRLISRQDNIQHTQDLVDGLTIISERAKGLGQFVESYKQLAKLPEPQKQPVSMFALFKKIATLFKDQPIEIKPSQDLTWFIDPIQFEQVLINLIKNAVDAMSQGASQGIICIDWETTDNLLILTITDQGCGIKNLDNLFVPFYTTKKHGSGIGLVLCRQIIEAHNGNLTLTNRNDGPGCCAIIEIANPQASLHQPQPAVH